MKKREWKAINKRHLKGAYNKIIAFEKDSQVE